MTTHTLPPAGGSRALFQKCQLFQKSSNCSKNPIDGSAHTSPLRRLGASARLIALPSQSGQADSRRRMWGYPNGPVGCEVRQLDRDRS